MDHAGKIDNGAIDVTTGSGAVRAGFIPDSIAAKRATNHITWLIDNAEAYGRCSIRCAARDGRCASRSLRSMPIAPRTRESLKRGRAVSRRGDRGGAHRSRRRLRLPEIRILLNATWILNTARPLRKFFAARGVAADHIEVRGMSRFPHFMHAKLVLDRRVARPSCSARPS